MYFKQYSNKLISNTAEYKHVMAVSLDPGSGYSKGLVRCITSRRGDAVIEGTIDISEMHFISGSLESGYTVGDRIQIQSEEVITKSRQEPGLQFLGLEDPDIYIDEITGIYHLYFTMPYITCDKKSKLKSKIHLGHAEGSSLEDLTMTPPVLISNGILTAKEVAIAPPSLTGMRNNLVESSDSVDDTGYSVIRVAKANDLGKPWEYGEVAFHPLEHKIEWIGGHASPGPFFPRNFINVGEGKLLGLINGREANRKKNGKTIYGMFSVGLYIYDYEQGVIEWVSREPFIMDTKAKTITFASQYVPVSESEGVVIAHVDDSFVRAYSITSVGIKEILKKYGQL